MYENHSITGFIGKIRNTTTNSGKFVVNVRVGISQGEHTEWWDLSLWDEQATKFMERNPESGMLMIATCYGVRAQAYMTQGGPAAQIKANVSTYRLIQTVKRAQEAQHPYPNGYASVPEMPADLEQALNEVPFAEYEQPAGSKSQPEQKVEQPKLEDTEQNKGKPSRSKKNK